MPRKYFAPERGIGRTLQSITLPLCSCSCLSGSPGWEMYGPWDKVQKQPSSGSISLGTLYTHFCNYILLLWKPRTFGNSSTQPLSHQPFWSQVWLLERKAQLGISYSIFLWPQHGRRPVSERCLKQGFWNLVRWEEGGICCCTWTNLGLSQVALKDFP